MPSADWTWKQGDSQPSVSDTLTHSDNTPVNLTGATVKVLLRSLASAAPITITGTTTITDPVAGDVRFAPSSADTSLPGQYMANWLVTFPDGSVMTFPTEGYLWVSIEENLTTIGGQQLVGLAEVKDHLNISRQERRHDQKLLGMVHAIRPQVEAVCGPILLQTFDEWHDGGQDYIMLRHVPSTGLGTSPIINLLACSEYAGAIEWTLAIVASPELGTQYSVMVDPRLGRVVRRGPGGGVQPFPYQPQSVHVIYEAGQASIPTNVREGALEWIRVNHDVTQGVGHGSRTIADEQDSGGMMLKVPMPAYVRQMLAPNRKFPALA